MKTLRLIVSVCTIIVGIAAIMSGIAFLLGDADVNPLISTLSCFTLCILCTAIVFKRTKK